MAGLMDVFVKIGADTSGLESGISKAKGLASGLGGVIGTGMKMVGAAVGAATTAVGAFAASATETGKTFDSSMSQVAATMGVTTDEIGELRDFAMEMGAKTAFSATQAADALNYMALAGYDAETSMQMLPNVLNLAAAGNMDLATASDMVTDAQTALGLSLSETTELVDMMAKTSSKSNTSVAQLGDAILTIGGTAKSLAGGTNELNMMLGVLADNGIKGAEGGTHLRNAILSLSAPTDNAAKALSELGIVTQDAEGNMLEMPVIMAQFRDALDGLGTSERADIISTIFNKTDIAAVNALIDTESERYRELSVEIDGAWMSEKSFLDEMKGAGLENAQKKLEALGISQEEFMIAAKTAKGSAQEFLEGLQEISGANTNEILSTMQTNLGDLQRAFDNVSGSAEQMAHTQLENLSGDIDLWKSALEGTQLLISGALTPTLRDFVQFGTEGLTQISDAFKEGGLNGAMEAFKGVLSDGIGMVTEKIPEFVNAGIELLGALGQGLIDNAPVIFDGLMEIGGMLAESGLALMEQFAEGIKTFDFATAVGDVINFLVEMFTGDNAGRFLDAGFTIITSLAQGIMDSVPKIADGAVKIIGSLTEGIQKNLPQMIPAAMNAIMEFSGSLRENAGKLVDAGLKMIMAIADGLIQNIPVFIQTIPTIVSNIAGIINDNAPKLLIAGVQLIIKLVEGIIKAVPTLIAEFPKIVKAIIDVWTAINWINLGTKIITGIVNGVKNLSTQLPNTMKSIGEKALNFVKSIDWKNLGASIINLIKGGITGLATAIPLAIKAIGLKAIELVKSIDWIDLGKNIVMGIASGIAKFASSIWDAITSAVKGGKDAAKKEAETASPSKWFRREIGKNISLGIAYGIEDEKPAIEDAMDGLTDMMDVPEVAMDSNMNAKAFNKESEGDDIDRLAKAIVRAFIDADIDVEVDGREFGRLVRKAVAY